MLKFIIAGIIGVAAATILMRPTALVPFDKLGYEAFEEEIKMNLARDWVAVDTFGSAIAGYSMLGVDTLDDYRHIRLDVHGRVICAPGPERVRPKFESNFP